MLKRTPWFIVILLLFGCTNSPINTGISDDKILEGIVVEKTTGGVLLELVGESLTISDKVYVGVEDKEMIVEISEGQQVRVWYDLIRESYPPQAQALKIEEVE